MVVAVCLDKTAMSFPPHILVSPLVFSVLLPPKRRNGIGKRHSSPTSKTGPVTVQVLLDPLWVFFLLCAPSK